MNNAQKQYSQLWATTKQLSQSYWNQYNQLICPLKFSLDNEESDSSNETSDCSQECSDLSLQEHNTTDNSEVVNREYFEFIEITRKHQQQREFLKEQQLRLEPEVDEYYRDISEVNTLVEDNIAQVPERNKISNYKFEEQKRIDACSWGESYDRIRSLEMCIDDIFRTKCQKLQPVFWPVIPLNPKPYLNKP